MSEYFNPNEEQPEYIDPNAVDTEYFSPQNIELVPVDPVKNALTVPEQHEPKLINVKWQALRFRAPDISEKPFAERAKKSSLGKRIAEVFLYLLMLFVFMLPFFDFAAGTGLWPLVILVPFNPFSIAMFVFSLTSFAEAVDIARLEPEVLRGKVIRKRRLCRTRLKAAEALLQVRITNSGFLTEVVCPENEYHQVNEGDEVIIVKNGKKSMNAFRFDGLSM